MTEDPAQDGTELAETVKQLLTRQTYTERAEKRLRPFLFSGQILSQKKKSIPWRRHF